MRFYTQLILIFHYGFFKMIEWNKGLAKRSGESAVSPSVKAYIFFGIMEIWLGIAIYLLVGRHISSSRIQLPPSLLVWIFSGLMVTFLNRTIVGNEERQKHYRRLFVSWDRKKQNRWSLCLLLIVVVIIALFLTALFENVK